ncbi:MAG TPA: hypothetical protein VGC34_06085 [Steroidobacteraceae bacterium]
MDSEGPFNPFSPVDAATGPFAGSPQLRNPEEDTGPLQGSKDLSDTDSLEDVIADSHGHRQLGADEA